MKFGGLQETSLLDYPGKVCAIVWTVGCNFRCPFCYNPDLVTGKTDVLSGDHVLSFLDRRIGKLDALSITGGEPLIYDDIADFIGEVKERGFLVKVDTNGSFPERLEQLLEDGLIDFVSMDVKAPAAKYNQLTGIEIDFSLIQQSIKIIMQKAKDYEFKTTVIPRLLEKSDITLIASLLKGAKRYYLQQFKMNVPVIDQRLISNTTPFTRKDFEEMQQIASSFVESCELRGV